MASRPWVRVCLVQLAAFAFCVLHTLCLPHSVSGALCVLCAVVALRHRLCDKYTHSCFAAGSASWLSDPLEITYSITVTSVAVAWHQRCACGSGVRCCCGMHVGACLACGCRGHAPVSAHCHDAATVAVSTHAAWRRVPALWE